VLNNGVFIRPSDALTAYTSPVAYLRDSDFVQHLDKIASNINKEQSYLRGLGPEAVAGFVFHMLRFAALCTKHPGFEEELEWRIVYSPSLGGPGPLVKDIQSIRGVVQPIYKIPLKDIPDKGLTGAEIPSLLNRLIIGPTQYPFAIHEAFVDLLTQAGVQDAAKKVVISDIPLRR
jgi:hypothetical protein